MASWLVRRYPQPWRLRYEDEVLALLEDSFVRWRDIADLVRGLLIERARALIEPGDHPFATAAIMFAVASAAVLAVAAIPALVGIAARHWIGPLPGPWRRTADIAVAVTLFWICLHSVRWYLKHPVDASSGVAPPPPRGGAGLWTLAAAASTLSAWATGSLTGLYLVLLSSSLIPRWKPWQRTRTAVLQLAASRHEMKWALMELERCVRLDADGMPSPLADARANVERIQKMREDALATLHAMGYRASLSPSPTQAPSSNSPLG